MATVCAEMSMTLDGFVADPDDDVAEVFAWYSSGPVDVPTADPRWTFHTSAASAAHLRAAFDQVGAVVTGRRLFDDARAWGGNHPTGAPVIVVTHTVPDGWPRPGVPFTSSPTVWSARSPGRPPRPVIGWWPSRAPTSPSSASTPGCSTRSW